MNCSDRIDELNDLINDYYDELKGMEASIGEIESEKKELMKAIDNLEEELKSLEDERYQWPKNVKYVGVSPGYTCVNIALGCYKHYNTLSSKPDDECKEKNYIINWNGFVNGVFGDIPSVGLRINDAKELIKVLQEAVDEVENC